MTEDKFYMSPTANTIIAELTNHFQRTRFITPATDEHYSLSSEDYFCLCYQNISHQQQFFFWTTAWGFSANLPLRMWCKSTWKVTWRISYIWWNWEGERLSKWLDQYIINNPYACWHTLILLSLPTLTLKNYTNICIKGSSQNHYKSEKHTHMKTTQSCQTFGKISQSKEAQWWILSMRRCIYKACYCYVYETA